MKVLVIRFSAMGDVAMTVPALRGVLEANSELELTMVTNAAFQPMFNEIERLQLYVVRLKDYSGLLGLRRLFRELKELEKWDAVLDLHSVMRSWIIGGFFRLNGVPVYRIDKGREEKAELVKKHGKNLRQLKHSSERYLDVFKACGLDGKLASGPVIIPKAESKEQLDRFLDSNGLKKEESWIGIAPFSVHRQKTWPLEKVSALIARLVNSGDNQIFLFGGPDEATALKGLCNGHSNCRNMAGVLSLSEEIALVHELDVMIAMDSFNMHLAALCGTKVVSIWGGTHHYAGFGPLNNNVKNIVEINPLQLTCRPCSVFGSKPCYRGDWACLERIEVDDVLAKLT